MRVLRVLPLAVLVALGVAPPPGRRGGGDRGDGPLVSDRRHGLDSPRHLAFGSRGDLFVAEAGPRRRRCRASSAAKAPPAWARRGAVTKVDRCGRQSRIADGLAVDGQHARTTTTRSARTASSCSAATRADHQRRPDRAQGRRPGTDPARDARGPEPGRQPVRQCPGARRRGRPIPLADIWDFERRRQPGRGGRQPGDRLQPGRPDPSTAAGSSSPTRAATRSTRSTCSAASATSRVFPNRPDPEPVRPGPPIPMQAVPTSVA